MSLQEKFQNINKKHVAILASILFALAVVGVCGYEYYQLNDAKMKVEQSQDYEAEESMLSVENAQQNAQPTKKPSEYKIGIPYENAMKAKKPVIALFYADWCGYCIKFMPTFEALSKIYKDDYNFTKVNVEDPQHEKLVKGIGITGFPTVFILDPKYDNKILLSNAIFGDMKKFRIELDRFLRIRKMLDKKH